jgi:hypothetical protein
MIVIFRPQAVEDVIEAAAWYERQLISRLLLDQS